MSTTEKIQMKLSDSKSARWTALFIVSVTMMFGYFFTDVMSPLEPLLTAAKGAENGLGLGWSSDEYGFFSGAYGYFNVFLLLLFFGGLILDKFGIRFTGILSTVLMFGGALLKWYAVGHEFAGSMAVPFFGTYSTQVVIAALGFAIYGVGCEICGITVSKVIVKWFTGHELALAMGVQVATARLGTAAALGASLPFAKAMGGVSASIGLGAALLCAGVLVYLVYCAMDKKEDASAAAASTEPEEGFKFSDLGGLFKTTGFWYVAFLCLMFYAGVFPFLKFAIKADNHHMSIDAPFGSDDDDNAMVDVMASGDDSRTDKGVDFESMASELQRVLATVLKERERKILCYCYGIGCHEKGLEEIGSEFNLTRERVRQIREKSIIKLRESGKIKILMKYLG